MKNNKNFWSVAIIVNALIWAAIILINSWYFRDSDYFNVIFSGAIIISTLQMSVLTVARERIYGRKGCKYYF